MTKLDAKAAWERCQRRYPNILARLHQAELEEATSPIGTALRATYNHVTDEGIPDDFKKLIDRL